MTNNKQQTAVDLYRIKINSLTMDLFNRKISGEQFLTLEREACEQAKEMHKEEMVMFVLNVMGKYRHGDVLAEVATELYEKTYGGGKQ